MGMSREAAELRRHARRLREIGMIGTDVACDLAEVAADIDRQADALENPIVPQIGNEAGRPTKGTNTH